MKFKKKYPADFWRRVYRAYTRKDKNVDSWYICERSKHFKLLWEEDVANKEILTRHAALFLKEHPEFNQWYAGRVYIFYAVGLGVDNKMSAYNIRLKFLKWMIENI